MLVNINRRLPWLVIAFLVPVNRSLPAASVFQRLWLVKRQSAAFRVHNKG